jgi:hypothetical protein
LKDGGGKGGAEQAAVAVGKVEFHDRLKWARQRDGVGSDAGWAGDNIAGAPATFVQRTVKSDHSSMKFANSGGIRPWRSLQRPGDH